MMTEDVFSDAVKSLRNRNSRLEREGDYWAADEKNACRKCLIPASASARSPFVSSGQNRQYSSRPRRWTCTIGRITPDAGATARNLTSALVPPAAWITAYVPATTMKRRDIDAGTI